MTELFQNKPSDEIQIPSLKEALKRIAILEDRILGLTTETEMRMVNSFSMKPERFEKPYLFFLIFYLSFYGCQQMEPTVGSSAVQDSATQTTPPLVDPQISLNQVLNQEWILELITENGQRKEPVAGIEVTLRFSAEKLTGSAGCNRYFASYQTGDDSQLSITDIASTEMWCLQPEGIMEQETKFLQWLDKVNSYRINDGQLTLYGNDREQKLVFRKKHN